MSNATSLRSILGNVDGSAPSIQNAAGAMMKFYDRGASVAVNEWRNALQTCVDNQLLPLLYVANEVLQNSKRNRGNKFLEAMSPVLSQSLVHICSRDPTLVEKVRRTIKIWGDRQVYSTRFIGDVLQGLEPYRHGRAPATTPRQSLPSLSPSAASFSPGPSPDPTATTTEAPSSTRSTNDDDDIRNIMEDNDDEDDEDIFATTAGSQKLEVEINLGSALDEMLQNKATDPSNTSKRRRSSLGSQNSNSGTRKRRSVILSASNLLELWTRLSDLQQQYEGAQLVLAKIDERLQNMPADDLANLVGDELQQAYQQNRMDEKQMTLQRQKLHAIAQERHVLEQEAKRYLPWLEKALKQDEDDIVFSEMLEQKIASFQGIHALAQKARDERVAEEQRIRAQQQALERQRKEEEEQEKFRQAALAKETEARDGMVWNPTTREYQYLNTDESWRE
ncbi:regulator of Ty1 transposition protein 103 [Fistulifera solaris]|jgi:hypothetical protein|uniref:Regulator of Ty1 transposition protein 103 n=1 Tax=Fistulifera solaris TaxID=1519565 RepID=A0A1Z5K5A0_FISSO|nr:regulator of Ty1 transposition protein 103 [Fistulifera solaris]|eukprot:GAX21430.1 regulator of Ty1 transposition protein 103 [Fistulifera solaris]